MHNQKVSKWLSERHSSFFTIYTILAAFGTYSCMYAFRKPFAVATFDQLEIWGVSYKVLLIIAQIIGYALSKFVGIKVVSEMTGEKRAISILLLIGISGLALFLFAITPVYWNIIFLFLNGLPLGMVWGLVFSYLEGRRFTEVLGAGLSISFIFSSGFVKSIGSYLMLSWGISEFWMPFTTGILFAGPLVLFIWMLDQVPPPSDLDVKLRTERMPMKGKDRLRFFKAFSLGLIMLIIVYTLLTVLRDFRDNFAAEIWQTLGYGDSPDIFTRTEVPISLAILVILGSLMAIKSNFKALIVNHLIILVGVLTVGAGTFAFEQALIGPVSWMICIGFGLYLAYVPFNSIFFDRLIAAFKYVSNVGFLIYLADAFGYLGSVGVLFYKEFAFAELSWLNFFVKSCYIMSLAGGFMIATSLVYFLLKYQQWDPVLIDDTSQK
ncbi:DUF5690 family protein [Fulvivirgaceae bacterium BMA10]|uniref:DUF5690 family protein n=1 Tax=Splendidivirga corallicola TaxID=3051826 RepID=A0ABT8KVZ9_9BACT|nr:DUF5690 family protein [Fulvivirgaceae bacterium BMA10]